MRSTIPPALPLALGGLHAADQLSLAALPLIATLTLGAGPGAVGALMAAQGAAWLVVTLPAGVLVDRIGRRRVLAAAGFWAGLLSLAAMAAPGEVWLGLAAFLAAGAVVPGVLAGFSMVPSMVERTALAAANARLELTRAVATLGAPPLAGFLAGMGSPRMALGVAAIAGLICTLAAARLPASAARRDATRRGVWTAVLEGARFVRGEPHLAAIAAVAIGWNAAFFALQAVLIPLALGPLGLSPQVAGLALGAYGAGLVLAALVAPAMAARWSPRVALLAGPGLSVVAVASIGAAPWGPALILLGFGQFLLGFGPMLWQITQTSLRQAVAPAGMLGRVGATMQVAVFGVRPLGALAGGALATWQGPAAAVALAGLGFALSVALVLRSPLARLRAMPMAASAS